VYVFLLLYNYIQIEKIIYKEVLGLSARDLLKSLKEDYLMNDNLNWEERMILKSKIRTIEDRLGIPLNFRFMR